MLVSISPAPLFVTYDTHIPLGPTPFLVLFSVPTKAPKGSKDSGSNDEIKLLSNVTIYEFLWKVSAIMKKEANAVTIAYRFSNSPKMEPATNVRDENQLRTLFKRAKPFVGLPGKYGKPFHVKLSDVSPDADER